MYTMKSQRVRYSIYVILYLSSLNVKREMRNVNSVIESSIILMIICKLSFVRLMGKLLIHNPFDASLSSVLPSFVIS